MVKRRKNNNSKNRSRKGFCQKRAKARKINASTAYETCSEQLSPFGGLLLLSKFLDLIKLEEIYEHAYQASRRKPKLGRYRMVVGVLAPLFIGFKRHAHAVPLKLTLPGFVLGGVHP